MPYQDHYILYVDSLRRIQSYPKLPNTIFSLNPGEFLVGWAEENSKLFISKSNTTYLINLLEGSSSKAFSHLTYCRNTIDDTSLLTLMPDYPGHLAFIDFKSI